MGRIAPRRAREGRPRSTCTLALIAACLPIAGLTACGERSLGWGVVLWAPQPGIDAGSVLSITDESEIQDVYRYTEADTVHELERWRVRLFSDQQQADEFASAFSELANTYGYATRSGLPVRVAADAGSPLHYRLREGEVVKIIARSEAPVEVGAYTNYWYQVLTTDGTQGFTFGELLPLFATAGDPQVEADRRRRRDPVLAGILNARWRPQDYADMLASRRIDLTRMTEEYGLTFEAHSLDDLPIQGSADAAEVPGTARIVLPDLQLSFHYDGIERIGDDRYRLQGSGARIAVQSERRVAVSFQHEGRLQTQVFVTLNAAVSDLIAAERQRRDAIYESLRERGPLLRSSAYGDVLLQPERRFRWSGFQRLVPGVIPRDAAGTGTIRLRLHPLPALRAQFRGVLTLELDRRGEAGPPASVSFLYATDDDGVRLVLAGEIDDELLLVRSAAATPLTIYFRFGS